MRQLHVSLIISSVLGLAAFAAPHGSDTSRAPCNVHVTPPDGSGFSLPANSAGFNVDFQIHNSNSFAVTVTGFIAGGSSNILNPTPDTGTPLVIGANSGIDAGVDFDTGSAGAADVTLTLAIDGCSATPTGTATGAVFY
jgi:hypothetical protein